MESKIEIEEVEEGFNNDSCNSKELFFFISFSEFSDIITSVDIGGRKGDEEEE
jgi:hypothetical protein